MTASHPDSTDQPLRLAFTDGRTSEIRVADIASAPGLMEQRGLRPGACLVVTDENVARLHLTTLLDALTAAGWQPRARVVPAGEASKSLKTASGIYDWALDEDVHPPLTRETPVLALGGGVVGDLAAFAASTLLRGLPLVHLPTTLLAQVDSAIGGKTGIDHARGKNLIGTFHQPELVIADPEVLTTLPRREWTSGLAEVIKVALVADEALVRWLEEHWDDLDPRGGSVVPEMVRRAASAKVRVVEEDERERGRRAILNFGHTFGHAIERATEYLVYTHGEAVALGMTAALHLSHELNPALDRDRVETLLSRLPATRPLDVPRQALNHAMAADKKRTQEGLRFVVLEEVGRARVAAGVREAAVDRAWDRIVMARGV